MSTNKKVVSLVSPLSQCNTSLLRQQTSRRRSRSWCFTWNNYTEKDLSHLSHPEFFKMEINKMIFQEEIGENKILHLQGFIQFKNQIDFKVLKEYLPKCHLEKCKSIKASIKYCSKNETRCGRRYTFGISDFEMTKKKYIPLTQEEVLLKLKEDAVRNLIEDKDGFWKLNQIDY